MPHVVADAGLLDVNGTLIAEVIAFFLMVLILAKWVYPPIMRVATQREKQIEEGVRAADEAKARLESVQEQVAQTLNEARDQAREILARSHREAVVESDEVHERARRDADALVQRAQSEIAAERDRAIQDLRGEVSTLVVDAASKVIGETLDAQAHRRLIDKALEDVSNGRQPDVSQN